MELLIALILALIAATQGAEAGIERPQLEERPYIIEMSPVEALPPEVIPAEPGTTVDSHGTITNPDGTTDCVVASPCDYARAGYAPGQPENHPDIDPIWNSEELQP